MIHFFPNGLSSTGPGLLAGVTSGCSYLPGIMCGLSGQEVSLPTKGPIGHVDVGHRWDRVAMDLLDMSVTTPKGNRYVLVMVDCFYRWTEICPLPNKTALAVTNAFFQHIVCRFGMPFVIHSDQGREFENKVMQELCLLYGAHKTRTTPYHRESDGLVMMAYRSSVHESTGYSPYRLMF